MRLKRMLCLMLLLCIVMLCGCTFKGGGNITSDVKDNEDAVLLDEAQNLPQNEVAGKDEQGEDNAENEENAGNGIGTEEQSQRVDVSEFIAAMGCRMSEGGKYMAEAEKLCRAIVEGDTRTIADFTMGKSEYYDFVKEYGISSFRLYPFEFTEEKLAELNENGFYVLSHDNFLVELEFEKDASKKDFDGESLYCFGLEMDPAAGNLLAYFVPYYEAQSNVIKSIDVSYEEYFIDEFSSLFFRSGNVTDGRNFPEYFDFADSPHFITHIMAKSGVYGEPPYTYDEVNKFIADSFYGNVGLDISEINAPGWTSAGIVYESDDPERIYGCSWAHGGTSAELRIVNVDRGDESSVYTVELYADYSGIALSRRVDFYFDKLENGLSSLTLVNVYDDTGREMALSSV